MTQRILRAARGLSRRPWTPALRSQTYWPPSLTPCLSNSHARNRVPLDRLQKATFSCGRPVRHEVEAAGTQGHENAVDEVIATTEQDLSGASDVTGSTKIDGSNIRKIGTESADKPALDRSTDSILRGVPDLSWKMCRPVSHKSLLERFEGRSAIVRQYMSPSTSPPSFDSDTPMRDAIDGAFDQFSRDSDLRGLAWWAAAALQGSSFCSSHLEFNIGTARLQEVPGGHWHGNFGRSNGQAKISLCLRPDATLDSPSTPPVIIWLTAGIDKSNPVSADPTQGSVRDELRYLLNLIKMVTDYCNTMSFESQQSYVSKVAESLLRILDFRTTGLFLTAVTVRPVKKARAANRRLKGIKAKATWENTPTRPLQPDERKTGKVQIVEGEPDSKDMDEDEDGETNDLTEAEETEKLGKIDGTNHLIDLKTNGAGSEQSVIDKASLTNKGSAQYESLVSDVLQLEGSSGYAGYVRPSNKIKSSEFQAKTGFYFYEYAVYYQRDEHAKHLGSLTLGDVRETMENSFRKSDSSGLAFLQEAANQASKMLPFNPRVTLKAYAYPGSFSPLPCNRSAFTYQSGLPLSMVCESEPARSNTTSELSKTGDSVIGIILPAMHVKSAASNDVGKGKGHELDLNLNLRGNCISSESGSQETPLAVMQRMCALVETEFVRIFATAHRNKLETTLRECCSSVAQLNNRLGHGFQVKKINETIAELSAKMGKATRLTMRVNEGENQILDIAKDHGSVALESSREGPDAVSANAQGSELNHSRPDTEEENIFVALGSNVGDRVGAIEAACRAIDDSDDMHILETSPLYETEPMYVEDQERFLNGMCRIKTSLEPVELLDRLQAIENDLGRVKLIDKGPRNIDLDIVAYGNRIIDTERLTVPHRLMTEREFVLRPLCALNPGLTHPRTKMSVSQHLKALPTSAVPIYPLTPTGPSSDGIRATDPRRRTHIMSILNVTPDSFSDGGDNRPADVAALVATVKNHIAAGATIIDVGGQSSRPGAPDITAEEELHRILPAIGAIRSLPEAAHIAISVDTYRASVAEAAVNAGAHIVNDISAGTLDPEMLPTVARLGCTYIMMHMRGTPVTMQSEENTTYPPGLLFLTIVRELHARVLAAQEAGIRAWRIILDPGIGFGKTTEQNLFLLAEFHRVRCSQQLRQYPWLVGSSRKRFIGEVTGIEDAKDRVFGTAATVTAAIGAGADIVRVHDVKEMAQTVKVADALYRRGRYDIESRGDGNP